MLPFVKKYIKKQFYINKKIYTQELKGGRFYTDFYSRKYNLKDAIEYDQETLNEKYTSKLILGWNLEPLFLMKLTLLNLTIF